MITVETSDSDQLFKANCSAEGIAVYLDHFALTELAKHDTDRRRRFLSCIHDGADLLFSVSNAVDLAGPQGKSLRQIKQLLEHVGSHWYPIELNPFEVVNRELQGQEASAACLSKQFLNDFVAFRLREYESSPDKILSVSSDFFNLSLVSDWVGPQRVSVRAGIASLDDALIRRISAYRKEYDKDPAWLDRRFPELPFNHQRKATFTYVNLIRTLVLESKAHKLSKNDGLDFCHAIMATAFASVAALDKHWKRRVATLPKPNQLAPVYYARELDKFVEDLELSVRAVRASRPKGKPRNGPKK